MSTLYPAGFVETGYSCDGPRYIRNQPSRESGSNAILTGDNNNTSIANANLLNEKYTVEWNLPYKNLLTFVKQIDNQWNKLDSTQQKIISDMISIMLLKNPDMLNAKSENEQELQVAKLKELFTNDVINTDQLIISIKEDPKILYNLLKRLYEPSDEDKKYLGEQYINDLQKEIKYNIIGKNTSYKSNYYDISKKNIFIILFTIILFFIIGIIIGKKS